MANERYHSTNLRYVDADRLDKRVLDLDGLDVRNDAGDRLGDVDGLLVDATSGRPRYIVVDSGGWFSSRRFLIPVHHAHVDANRRALRVDFDRDTINRFPQMKEERFDAVTDEDARAYDVGVLRAWETSPTYRRDVAPTSHDTSASPAWWNVSAWLSESSTRIGADDRLSYVDTEVARGERAPGRDEASVVDDRLGDERRAPASGARAQPGDILGIERAGETTSIGDTAADEDKRREESEKFFDKNRR